MPVVTRTARIGIPNAVAPLQEEIFRESIMTNHEINNNDMTPVTQHLNPTMN